VIRFRKMLCLALCLVCLSGSTTLYVFAAEEPADELIQFVIDLLGDSDKQMRALGFEQVRSEAPGAEATKQFAAQLAKLSPDAQVGLLSALATRGDVEARSAVVATLASTKDANVRVAALAALGYLGSPDDCDRLIQSLGAGTKAEQAAAKGSLIRLQGDSVPESISKQMMIAKTSLRVALIEVLVSRRALDTIPSIMASTLDKDPQVRTAAMAAVGKVGGPEQIPGMVQGVLKATGSERAAAEKNVMFVCARNKDKAHRADPLIAAMKKLNRTDHNTMLSTLGRVGGPEALKIVQAAVVHRSNTIHQAGLRGLFNWPDASVAPQLIHRVKKDKHASHRLAALRALIRIAPLPDGRTNAEKLELLKQCMQMSTRDTERAMILKRAAAVRIPETLRYVLDYIDDPKFSEQVCLTIVELAHHRELRGNNKTEFHAALDLVIETSKDATTLDRANRYKRDETWVRPK